MTNFYHTNYRIIAPSTPQYHDRPSTKIKQRSPHQPKKLRSPLTKKVTSDHKKSNSDRPFNPKNRDRHSQQIKQRSPLSPPKITIACPQKSNSDRLINHKITIATSKNQPAIAPQPHNHDLHSKKSNSDRPSMIKLIVP